MSPPLDVVTLNEDEREDDPNCLHCHLGKVLAAWAEAHPLKSLSEMVFEVAEALGEMVASDAIECDTREFAIRVSETMDHVSGCAHEMRDHIAVKLEKDEAKAKERSRAH